MGLPGTNTMRANMTYRKDFSVRFPPLKRGGNLTLGLTHLTPNLTVANLLTDLTLPYANLTKAPYAKPYAIPSTSPTMFNLRGQTATTDTCGAGPARGRTVDNLLHKGYPGAQDLVGQVTVGKKGQRNDLVDNVNYVGSPDGNTSTYGDRDSNNNNIMIRTVDNINSWGRLNSDIVTIRGNTSTYGSPGGAGIASHLSLSQPTIHVWVTNNPEARVTNNPVSPGRPLAGRPASDSTEKTQNSHIVRFVGQNPRPPSTPTTLVLGAESRCNVRLAKKVGQNQRPFIAAGIADPAPADTGAKEGRLLGIPARLYLADRRLIWYI